ncbi:MAG: transposase [Candidatus Thiodiazotropha sp. (ex Ustalcina ferruginea)]|nr:transposase [Candidatus Thiodiazotropha sp. (ex Ustalcina ferruginea)]
MLREHKNRGQQGNNREPCFYAEEYYRHYLDNLRKVSVKYNGRRHAYVLMTNHVHLLVTPIVDHGVSQMMQVLGHRYVYNINKSYKRTDTLWEGRYKSSLIDSDGYLLTCMRYIELNPVRQWRCHTQVNTSGRAIMPMHRVGWIH